MGLVVLRPGLHSLLVDHGRPRSRSLGVPVGGRCCRPRSPWRLGNALVGNPPDAVGLEITLNGPVLRATQPVACVVFGARFVLTSSRQQLEVNRTFTLQAEEELHIGPAWLGVRAYLCLAGGIDTPVILGGRSASSPIKSGDILPCPASVIPSRRLAVDFAEAGAPHLDFPSPGRAMIWTLNGPQIDWFPDSRWFFGGLEDPPAFGNDPPSFRYTFGATFKVSTASNRMGLRLQGPSLVVPPRELVSEAVCPGTVQVTRDGQCIVLGVDAQTIGGYPKIAQVISYDLDQMGQLRPGDELEFVLVHQEEAEQLYREKQRRLQAWGLRLREAAGL